ncbi:MAG: immune inhibitor A [Flavobacterium sp.]|nr:immune inhibitor A [Flavobacterium sp.]
MKNTKYLLILFVSISFAQEKYQKVRIHYNSETEKQQIIRENEIDHFHQKNNSFIECEIPEIFVKNLKKSGKIVDIVISDMQAFVQQNINSRNANPMCSQPAIIDPVNYNTGSMAGYLTYAECMAELDEMHTLFPNLINTRASVGTFLTTENRALQFVKISDNPDVDEPEKRILYDAIHHAREPGSMQQLIYFMWYILENYSNNSEIKYLVDNTEIFCIPVVNPDGYIYNQTTNPTGGGMWRKNRRDNGNGTFGVDNNRNYSYEWGTTGVSLIDTTSDVYCGTAPFTEVENLALKWFCEQKNFTVAMNAHTFSSLVLYPFGYDINQPTPDENIFNGISAEMVKYSGYANEISATLYPASGDSDDWMYGDVSTKPKIFAFTPEVGTSFWDSPAKTVVNNRNMLYTNLMALRFLHNYASFEDKTENFISTTNFNFDFSLKRLGLVDNENFTVTLIPFSNNIATVSAPIIFNNMTYNAVTANNFQITLNPNTQQGEAITFIVEVNNGSLTQSYTITKYFGATTIIFNELGNNVTQWTPTANGWATTASTFYSASSCITDSPNGNYLDNKSSNIKTKNAISLINVLQAELSFYAKWDIEKGFDYTILEISNNNGTTWIPQCGKFTVSGTSSQVDGKPLYDGTQNTWVKETINLSDYIGSNILIRFRFKSDNGAVADGFYFDDLKVTVINPSSLSNEDFILNNINISPNPTANAIIIDTIDGMESYKIFNVSGQLVASEKIFSNKIDVNFLINGVYFLELSASEQKRTLKFVIEK